MFRRGNLFKKDKKATTTPSDEVIVRQALNLKVVILSEILEKIVSKRLDVVNPSINEHSFVASQIAGRANIWRIRHTMVRPERRHDTA